MTHWTAHLHDEEATQALGAALARVLQPGLTIYLHGELGAGKTSLLRTLIGALPPVDGQVRWGGRALAELTERERAAQVAFAAPRTPDAADFTVEHLVLVGRVAARGLFAAPTAADREQVDRALAQLGLERLGHRVLADLSDGERQLAQIARALAQGASALVLDEPAASLDWSRQRVLMATLRSLAGRGQAIVLSTHDPNHALALADQVLLWQPDGRIHWGPAAELLRPETLSKTYGVPVQLHVAEDGSRVFGIPV
jgi:iron complex transport system ATP-binding protein